MRLKLEQNGQQQVDDELDEVVWCRMNRIIRLRLGLDDAIEMLENSDCGFFYRRLVEEEDVIARLWTWHADDHLMMRPPEQKCGVLSTRSLGVDPIGGLDRREKRQSRPWQT